MRVLLQCCCLFAVLFLGGDLVGRQVSHAGSGTQISHAIPSPSPHFGGGGFPTEIGPKLKSKSAKDGKPPGG